DSAAPDGEIHLLLRHGNSICPRLIERGIRFVEDRPCSGVGVEAIDSGRRRNPKELPLHRDPIDEIVGETARQIGVILERPTGVKTETAERSYPHIAILFVDRDRHHCTAGQAIVCREHFLHAAIFQQDKSMRCSRPHTRTVDGYAIHLTLWKPIRRGVIDPLCVERCLDITVWHRRLCKDAWQRGERQSHTQQSTPEYARNCFHVHCQPHSVFRYSIKSLSCALFMS